MTEHLEALPSIDANQLRTIEADEIAQCFWRGPRGVRGGNGEFVWQASGTLKLTYEISLTLPPPLHEYFQDEINLSLIKNTQIEKPLSWWLECPGCCRSRRFLYFEEGEWLCRVCHRLQYASQRMGTPARLVVQAMEVTAKIAGGRPKGMHHRTYRALQAESKRLQSLAEEYDFREPNKEVMFRSTFEWGRRRRKAKKPDSVPVPPLF